MKKIVVGLLTVLTLTMCTTGYSNLLYTSYGTYSSEIPISPETGGQCAHFAEEMFYEFNGIKLNVRNKNTVAFWVGLDGKEFKSVNGHTYKVVIKTKPVPGSLLLTANGKHILYVEKVDKKAQFIFVLESSGVSVPRWDSFRIPYGDTWYVSNCYTFSDVKNAIYITTVFVK